MWAIITFILTYAVITGLARLVALPRDDSKSSKMARRVFSIIALALVLLAGLLITSQNG